MEVVITFLTFIIIMLVIQNRKLIKELNYLERKVDQLEAEIDRTNYKDTIGPLDLSKLMV